LRFRDLVEDTIPAHTSLLDKHGEVCWGWWKKASEPDKLEELRMFAANLDDARAPIGLFNRSTSSYYEALATNCHFDESGRAIDSPNPEITPEYYRGTKLKAWFTFVSIRKLDRRTFEEQFGRPGLGEETLEALDSLGSVEIYRSDSEVIEIPSSLIVHLSDIHFGADFGFPGSSGPRGRDLKSILLKDILQISGGLPVGILVVSGDLTSRGNGSYLSANSYEFLKSLSQGLNVPSERFIIVPGNHDIPLTDFTEGYDHETPFNDFVRKFYGRDLPQHRIAQFRLPSGRTLAVLTINSVKLRDKASSNYGWVKWEECHELLASSTLEENSIRLAVMHHHLVSAPPEDLLPDDDYPSGSISVTLNAGEVIEGLQSFGFHVVLHGHQHYPMVQTVSRVSEVADPPALSPIPLALIGAGSAGAKSDRLDGGLRDNSYNLLDFKDEPCLRVVITTRRYASKARVRKHWEVTLNLERSLLSI
jgi:predicted phosphodiesterase